MIEGRGRGLMPVLLLVALAFSMALIATPALAPAVISEPGGTTIAVPPGGEFVLRFRLRWDQAEPGTYAIPLAWDSPRPVVGGVMQDRGTEDENFTLVGASAYFDNGDAIGTKAELLEGPSPDNENLWRYGVIVANVAADSRNGEFNVDVLFRAAGTGGVPHAVTENHPIVIMGTIDVVEKAMFMYTPPNPYVTVKVLALGVAAEISPGQQSGPPGATLTYAVTVTNTGGVEDNYALKATDDAGWGLALSENLFTNVPPGENRRATLTVAVPENAATCTQDEVVVTVIGTGVENSATCVAHALILRGVSISIAPNYQGGLLGSTLSYTVTITNTGNVKDNYSLTVSDNENWGPMLSPTLLTVPAEENRRATLTVTIPENATPCTEDNITIVAISVENAEVSASETCIAHAVELLTKITKVIYPIADVYAYGEYGRGYSRAQLKFDISGIPPGSNITSAELWLFRWAADRWDGNVALFRVDDQIWGEAISASEFDAQLLSNGENCIDKFTSSGWDHLNVSNQLKVDYGAGHTYTSFRLRWVNDNGDKPSIGIDDGRFLVINSELDGLSIVFCSTEYDGNDPYLKVTYVPPYAVSASISPAYKSGLPGETISYVLTIVNTGNLEDNYILVIGDNLGWGPSISPTSMVVPPGKSGQAIISVTVPENAAPCTKDNVIVEVISTGDPSVSASVSCVAHRVKAEFRLATLFKVSLDLDVYLTDGSRLVVKFHTYAGDYQGENVIWSGPMPAHVVMLENIPQPENKAVEKVALVLTDDVGNVIQTWASFTVTKGVLWSRMVAIKGRWLFAGAEERDALWSEIVSIKGRWLFAPT